MGLQWGLFQRRSAGVRNQPEEALDSLRSALEKTEPDAEEASWQPLLFDSVEEEEERPSFLPFERWAQARGLGRFVEEPHSEAQILERIEVVAFVGPSGTGKSTRVIELSRELGIAYFIDDGLLIHGSRIICGTSAKRASTRMESVRQAIFLDETRAENMRRALAQQQPEALMILGTSDSMLEKICTNLHLHSPARTVRIEEITTPEERRVARQTRLRAGQHTIPVPSLEIKHEFNGSFFEPLSRFKRRLERDKEEGELFAAEGQKTVVRPTFSSLGSYSISNEALRSLTLLILRRVEGLAEILDFEVHKEVYGVAIQLELALYYGFAAQEVMRAVQQKLTEQIEEYTSINVMSVDIKARRVVLKQAPNRSLESREVRPDRQEVIV